MYFLFQIKNVLLVNCGGCIDLVEYLQPADDIKFYIADNHRPLDVCNIYSDGQVRNMFLSYSLCSNLNEVRNVVMCKKL